MYIMSLRSIPNDNDLINKTRDIYLKHLERILGEYNQLPAGDEKDKLELGIQTKINETIEPFIDNPSTGPFTQGGGKVSKMKTSRKKGSRKKVLTKWHKHLKKVSKKYKGVKTHGNFMQKASRSYRR
jgi:hypothetical protein